MKQDNPSPQNQLDPARPDNASLETRASLNFPSGGKNKSVWQSMVDASGFASRHPGFFSGRPLNLMDKYGKRK